MTCVSVEQYCIWTDGLSALLGKELGSDLTRSDLDTLMSMEMKLRLLDLENITIPEAPPPVPKEPSTYNFTYNYGWDTRPFKQCVFLCQRWSVSLRYIFLHWRVKRQSVCVTHFTFQLVYVPILHMNYESIFSVSFQMFARQKNKRFFGLQVFESHKSIILCLNIVRHLLSCADVMLKAYMSNKTEQLVTLYPSEDN